jgi:hypothetical protein
VTEGGSIKTAATAPTLAARYMSPCRLLADLLVGRIKVVEN